MFAEEAGDAAGCGVAELGKEGNDCDFAGGGRFDF